MQLRTKLLAGVSLAGLAVAAFVAVNAAEVFTPSAQPVGYIGQPVPSNIDVSSGTEKMFSIDYNSFDWSGNLHAYPITKTGAIGAADAWTGGAAAAIGKQTADSRIIVTRNESGSGGMPFRWVKMSKDEAGYRKLLDPTAVDADDSDILKFVRGDTSKELKNGGGLRSRGSVLGDIIHSTPVYHNDGTSKTVFVGANDGMLHAINAADGSERFAYIPGALMGGLKDLASKDYKHRYYVDGGISLRTMDKQTFLVGALGAGGQALYALDVTSMPADETSAASKVLWEVTNKTEGYKDLGYTYSAPVLVKLNATTPAAVVGNGYYGDPATSNGHAVLYVINAKTGELIRPIDTGAGSASAPNGLSSPSVRDSDNDGYSDTAYAGDLLGNMWMFDLIKGTSTLLHDGGGAGRSITMAPGLASHPAGGSMVLFVTGRLLTPGDLTAKTTVDHAIGVWDKADLTKGTYVTQTLTEREYTLKTGTEAEKVRVRTVTNEPLNYSGGVNKGWKVELKIDAGERVVGDGAYVNGKVFQFFTTNPTKTPDAKPPGENWWMQLNYLTGGDTHSVVFDLNVDRAFTADDLIDETVGSTTTTYYPVGRHMGGGVRSQLVGVSAGGIDVFQASFDRNGAPKPPVIVDVLPEVVKGERGVEGGHFDTDFFCYVRCGNLKSSSTGAYRYATTQSSNGYYSLGRAADNAVEGKGLNYVHVHEYDDIYDVTGLSMINPSQDLQRLHTVSVPAITTKSLPDTPALKAAKTYPPEATTVAGTPTTSTTKVASNTQKTEVSYLTDSAITYVSGPVPVLVSGKVAMVTTREYTSTYVENAYSYTASGDKKAPYWQKRTRTEKTWKTTLTESATTDNTEFKLLMANQQHSPAISFKVLGAVVAGKQAEYDGPVIGYQTQDAMKVAEMTKYSMASVKEMMWSMPLNAFTVKEWVPGEKRTGVHPMHPNCAGVAVKEAVRGAGSAWRNGALTLQIVSANITQDDIELNVAGQPKLGYRLKKDRYEASSGKLIAEYLIYWHHPEVRCMTDGTYNMAPPVTTKLAGAPAIPGKSAEGAKDPKGVFVPVPGKTPDDIPPPPPNTVTNNLDGSVTTIVWTHTPQGTDGGYIRTGVSTTVWPNGSSGSTGTGDAGGVLVGGETEDCVGTDCKPTVVEEGEPSKSPNIGRINWRELQR
ncbi:hypothetical protein F2P45_20240 [Massilia sp. CCM 8733]|uniref:PilY1 beta-propeller domain-containing protein n=1 Tax=Massilia mucilaginosa TaxID=2609282 RepID=A0ABX0NWS6_9BURK|nr:PilC/PilY family type IV pilus protein [Massilia mucilaginosa]NHZ91327.1 hypothetical protein [Massilia mucilaginosa]